MRNAGGIDIVVAHADTATREALARSLRDGERVVRPCRGSAELYRELARGAPDVLLLGELANGEDDDPLECCRRVHGDWPHLPILILGSFADPRMAALRALRAGATDLLAQPCEPPALEAALARAVARPPRGPVVRRLSSPSEATEPGRPALDVALVGWGPTMRDIARRVRDAALHDVPVLVTGESGTGKELVAKALHDLGSRRGGSFVAINCAAVPPRLMESELFGHARGAFTTALKARRGLLLEAHGGTLFLDEVDSMPIELQPKLLRALEERVVRPVGVDEEVPFETRVVSACSADPGLAVREGRLREDLRYRLDVLRVDLLPLRERGDDVLALAQQFLQQFAEATGKPVPSLSEDVRARLARYPWPGNVRELRNCMEHAVAVTDGEVVEADALPQAVRSYRPSYLDLRLEADLPQLHELEEAYIDEVLAACDGNKARAASMLGISRATLYRKLRRAAEG